MRKMLKHDLRAVWPVWRILAPLVLLVAVFSGVVVRFASSEAAYDIVPQNLQWIMAITASLLTSLWPMMMSAFVVVILILIVIRYYKNFFTDEGYLTFTLPVSRTKLLNSKILMAFIWMGATLVVCLIAYISFTLILSVGTVEVSPPVDVYPDMSEPDPLFGDFGMLFFLFELIVFCVMFYAADILLLLLCITFGSVIVKRAKLLLGLGLYYVINSFIGVAMYVFFIGVMVAMVVLGVEDADSVLLYAQIAVYGTPALGILLTTGLAVGSYLLNLNLIKKKLNLP